jgi:hypothetical protein
MANAHFPIIRAKGTLPDIAPAAKADIDVRTGARELAEGISALGESIQKYELMQASTQLSEFKRKVREEHNRLAISYDGNLDPTTFKAEYEKSLQVRRGLIPKNRFAAQEARLWLNDRMPVWETGVEKSRQLRIEDNYRAEGFNLKTEAERTGDVNKYNQHLGVGRLLGIYGSEEIIKLKQDTLDEAERNLINSLIRDGRTDFAFSAIEKSQLDEGEKRSLEMAVTAAERAKQTQIKLAQEQKDNEIGDTFLALLDNKLDPTKPQLTFEMISNAKEMSLPMRLTWFTKLMTFDNYSEAELKEAFVDKGEVLADIFDRLDNNTITDNEIREQVGRGLSVPTAQRIIKERRQPFEKDTEQLFKRIFGWSPELGFKDDFAGFLYEKALREWDAEVKEQEATGEKIIQIGRSIVRPYFLEHLERTMASDTDMTRMMELALGEETEKLKTPKPIEAEEPAREPGEPLNIVDFEAEVSRLKGIDMKKAREYYDAWIGRFQE